MPPAGQKGTIARILKIFTSSCNNSLRNMSQNLPISRTVFRFIGSILHQKYVFTITFATISLFSSHSDQLILTSRSHFLANNCFRLHHTISQCHCKVSRVTSKSGIRVILNQLIYMRIISWVNQSLHTVLFLRFTVRQNQQMYPSNALLLQARNGIFRERYYFLF